MTSIGKRIEIAATKAGGVPLLAERSGIAKTTLYGWIKGPGEPRASDLRIIVDCLGVSLDWLVLGEGGASRAGASPGGSRQGAIGERVSIPRYAVQASAGSGAVVLSQEIEDYFSVAPAWLSRYIANPAKAGIIEARGDSMEPTIADGDILLIDFSVTPSMVNDGGVFVISVDGALLVKRLQVTVDGHVLIRSDNPLYEQERVTREFADEHMTVHAKVVWAGGPVRRR
jgi:hypothetical protein